MKNDQNQELVTTLQKLIEFPSLTGREADIADFIMTRALVLAKELGDKVKVARMGNCVAVDVLSGTGNFLALVGHLDTVPGNWFYETPYNGQVSIDAERIVGLGASDMKAGVAVMLELMRPEVAKQFIRPVRFIYYDHEEAPSKVLGLAPLFVREPWLVENIECAVILEPTDGGLQLGCMGLVNAEVVVEGRAAHSARPWQGTNAIEKALPLLERVSNFGVIEHKIENLIFKEVLSATRVIAGDANNIVPGSCLINLNYRFPPGRTIEESLAVIDGLVAGDGQVQVTGVLPAGDVPTMTGTLERFRSEFDLPIAPKQAYTDVAVFSSYKIPVVNFGPGHSAQCHQRGEWASLALLQTAYEQLLWLCSHG